MAQEQGKARRRTGAHMVVHGCSTCTATITIARDALPMEGLEVEILRDWYQNPYRHVTPRKME